MPVNLRNGRMPNPYRFELYRGMRSAVEGFYGWLGSFRKITLRYERLAIIYKVSYI